MYWRCARIPTAPSWGVGYGLLLRCKAAGARIGVVDLTRGELGTRGNAKLRDEERTRATAILGLDVDGWTWTCRTASWSAPWSTARGWWR